VASDFNGDGLMDAAVGDPGQSVNGAGQAGVIHIRSGATPGQVGDGADATLTQADIGDTPEAGDRFGSVMKIGYLDGDTCADLVIGVPQEDVGTVVDAGVVHVVFGAVEGLGKGIPSLMLRQGVGGMPVDMRNYDNVEAGDQFGAAVDATISPSQPNAGLLVIGVPGEDVGTIADAGMAVFLLFRPAGTIYYGNGVNQDTQNVPDAAEAGDRFGAAVAARQSFSGRPGVLIGVPGEDVNGKADAGMLAVIQSFDTLNNTVFGENITQDSDGVGGAVEAGDLFGASLTGSGGSDMFAIGVPREDLNGIVDAGMAHVVFGDTLSDAIAPLHQDLAGVADTAEAGDRFGSSLAFSSGEIRLAVGIPSEDRGTLTDAGAVHEFRLSPFNNVFIDQETLGGVSQAAAHFGASLAYVGERDQMVLLTGAPDDAIRPSGLVHVIPRPLNMGAPISGVRTWTPGEGNIPAGGDSFGAAVAGAIP
jgi:hypothetical protein